MLDRMVSSVAAVVLAGLVLAAGLSARFGVRARSCWPRCSVLWLVVDAPMEGPVLVVVTRGTD